MFRSYGLIVLVCTASTLACDGGDEHEITSDCSREGDFIGELGQGQESFEPIPEGGEPTVHYGAQGGTHLVLAARLITPDPLDRYEISLTAEIGQEPCTGGDCSSYQTISQITQTIEGAARIRENEAGELEIPSLFVVVENWSASSVRRITMEITDVCERRTTVVRTFVSAP